MKLNKAFITQLNTVLGMHVTFDYEHNKLWSNWCKITGISVKVDATGEFTECKFNLTDIVTGKDMYTMSIVEIYTVKDVENVVKDLVPLVYDITAGKLEPEYIYIKPIMLEYSKAKHLLETYPIPEEVPSV